MIRHIFRFFTLLLMTGLVLASLLLVGAFYDRIGILNLPAPLLDGIEQALAEVRSLSQPGAIVVKAPNPGGTGWHNPLADSATIPQAQPTAQPALGSAGLTSLEMPAFPAPTEIPAPTETPAPPPTPVPTLRPPEYQALATGRLKTYSAALQGWLDANDRLRQDNAIIDDPGWQRDMTLRLADVRAAGWALARVGAAPEDYSGIDGWLARVGPESDALADTYARAMRTRDPQEFLAAGNAFTRIKEDLTQAADLMIAAGWSFQ